MAQATATQIYEHNGKKYRLADHRDVGNNFVHFSDTDFDDAMNSRIGTTSTLTEINDEEFPFCAKSTQWKLAFVETSEVVPAPVPAVVPFNGTLEVGQWYETNNGQRLHCNSRTHHVIYPMVMVQEDGCVETYMEKGLWIEDYDMDDDCSIALQLVGCTGFDWTKPVPPAVVPEPVAVDTRPQPPAGWRYLSDDEVLVRGDVYMQHNKKPDDMTTVQSAIGETIEKLHKHGTYRWHNDWVGVIRKLPKQEPVKRDTGVAETDGWRILGDDEIVQEGDMYNASCNDWKGKPIDQAITDNDDSGWLEIGPRDSGIGKSVSNWESRIVYARKVEKVFSQSDTTEVLDDLCKTIHAKNVAAGWWDAADNPLIVPVKLMLAVTELAEACEGDRKTIPDTHLPHRSMLSVELADAVIRIADLAGFLNVPLGTVIAEKEAYNASRADHKPEVRKGLHGKRY